MDERDEPRDNALFQRDGDPAGFFLHPSIKDASQRRVLIKNIQKYGGKVLNSEKGADTVLVDEKRLPYSRQQAQLTYSLSRDATLRRIVVEPMRFVQDCIRRGEFFHISPQRQGMGGRLGARTRTEYTQSDDDNLCWYLSRRIPNAKDGGRVSRGVYKDLMIQGEYNPEYAWACRHPVQSWLERYKKNRERLDPIIQRYVALAPPEPPSLYPYSRRYNKRVRRALKAEEIGSDDEFIELTDSEEDETESEEESSEGGTAFEDVGRMRKRRRLKAPASSDQSVTGERHPLPSPIPSHLKGKGVAGRSPKKVRVDEDPFELQLLEPKPSSPASASNTQTDAVRAPSATLVPNASPALPLPKTPSIGYQNTISITPFEPSTSFRNVVHSSPAIHKDTHRDTITSGTEPSSRSVVIPTELSSAKVAAKDAAQAPPDASQGQAESSITRESSHKKSSPPPAPVRTRNAVRKVASRQKFVFTSSEDEGWAPYRNTRSQLRSVEPVPLPTPRRKRGRKPEANRTEKPLEPVYEGEFEQEDEVQDSRKQQEFNATSAVMADTYQDEQDVANLLTKASVGNSEGLSTKPVRHDQDIDKNSDVEGTEDEGEGIKVAMAKKEEEEESESDVDKAKGEEADDEDEDYGKIEGGTVEGKQKELSAQRSSRETVVRDADIGRRAERPELHKPRLFLDSDDEEVEQRFASAKDVMAALGDSPVEMLKRTQRRSLGTSFGGSPILAMSQSRASTLPSMYSRSRAPQPSLPTASPRASIGLTKKHIETPTLSGRPDRSQSRPPSISSSNSEHADFPLSGTRARAVKSELEQWMKESPYRPPSGTRAAQLSQQRRNS